MFNKLKYLFLLCMLFVLVPRSIKAQGADVTVRRNNEFTIEFYYSLAFDKTTNVLVSPFSLSSALAMVYPGARQNTADQMSKAMRYSPDMDEHNKGFNSIFNTLSTTSSLALANKVWIQQSEEIPAEYLNIAKTYFGAGIYSTDFHNNVEKSRRDINADVEASTKNKIKELIPQGALLPITTMVLTNAVYFQDAWRKPFDVNRSKSGLFHFSSGKTAERMFMEQDGLFSYFEDEVVTVLELPYERNFSMVIVLPKKSLADVHNYFNYEYYSGWELSQARFRKIQIPRFSIESEVKTRPILENYGMTDLFDMGQCDLSGIVNGYYVADIFHKAFIDVNEKGTTAAAATAVSIEPRSAAPQVQEFIADKPFIFLLRDRRTGSIIFIGKVEDPKQ